MKVILVPDNTDLNRGDQALVWESIRLIEDIYDCPEITLMCDADPDLYSQTKALGYPYIKTIIKHPARIIKKNNHVKYTSIEVFFIGFRAILDFLIVSLLLIRCKLINRIGLCFMPKDCRDTFSAFDQCDAVYVKGGGFIHSYGAISDPYQIFYLVYPMLLAIRMKKNVIILPNSIGPLKNRIAAKIVLFVLNHSKYISVRESVSEHFLKSQDKLHVPVSKHSDLGYHLRMPTGFDSKCYLSDKGLDMARPIVGITLRPYRFPGENDPEKKYCDYINGFVTLITYLVKKGYQVVLFSHTLGPRIHENDTIAVDVVSDKLKTRQIPHVTIDDPQLNCRQVMSVYSNFKFLIGTRFHSVIFAQNSFVPTIAISYGGNKGVGIMEDVGLSDFSIPMNSISGEALIELFEDLEKKEESVKDILREYRGLLDEDREKMIDEIRELLSI